MKRKPKCIHPGCKNRVQARGLCIAHYYRIHDAIKRGEDTWAKSEKEGRSLPSTRSRSTPAVTPTSAPLKKVFPPWREVLENAQASAPISAPLKKAVEKTTQAVHSKLCLVPGCSDAAKTRGLCNKDYAIANTLVKKGATSWKKLIAAGKAEQTYAETPRVQRTKDFFLGK